ncbi:MAG: hypothetical protein IT452_07470 [Planctomycetia bacterium]|nr:hypothetical protein [Planctomycetia bacterium]
MNCFFCGENSAVLYLGVRGNAHLSKVNVGPPPAVRRGPEYLVEFKDETPERPTGRVPELAPVLAAVRDWLVEGVSTEALQARHPFVDAERRRLMDIAARVNARLSQQGGVARVGLDERMLSRESAELWVYSAPRSARLTAGTGDSISIALLLHRTQVATGDGLAEDRAALVVRKWIDEAATTTAIHEAAPEVERHPLGGALEEGIYAAWHWGNVLCQAQTDSVLKFYRPLLDRVVKSEVVSRFFSFTSLDRLCFSRCSLYPFDTSGLPIISPTAGQEAKEKPYTVQFRGRSGESLAGTDGDVFKVVEAALAKETETPYFGNVDDPLPGRINREFAACGSTLRAVPVQRQQWLEILVSASGGTRCRLHGGGLGEQISASLEGADGKEIPDRQFAGDLKATVQAVIRWLGA